MAYIADNLWCNPKWLALSDKSKVVLVNSWGYSSGLGLKGHLTIEAQRLMGATPTVRDELIKIEWWDENGDGMSVVIHDWDDYNGKRDERRAADRERKRRWREKTGHNL